MHRPLRRHADVRPPLYVAAGGGGDAVAAAMLHAVRWPNKRPVIATFAWDRLLVDPIPGPRSTGDFTGLAPLGAHNFAFTSDTRPIPPAGSTLPRLAAEVDATYVLLDPSRGAIGLRTQMAALIQTTQAESVEVIDVGGDVLGTGTEPTLRSPLADALAVAATTRLSVPVSVLVAGAGLDGELTETTVLTRVEHLGGHCTIRTGPTETEWAIPLFEWHPSEATALLLAAARGLRGHVEIRSDGHRVRITDESPNVYALAHDDVLANNHVAAAVADTKALDEVEAAVRAVCGHSEIDYEREKAARVQRDSTRRSSLRQSIAVLDEYQRNAKKRGLDYVTFRRLAEVAQLRDVDVRALRECLVQTWSEQYEAPLWRLPG
jgi:hypothetical protein